MKRLIRVETLPEIEHGRRGYLESEPISVYPQPIPDLDVRLVYVDMVATVEVKSP